MRNTQLIWMHNKHCKNQFRIKEGIAYYSNRKEIINGNEIQCLINAVNGLHQKFPNVRMPIVIDYGEISISDKLTYITLETIIYSLIQDYKHKVSIFMRPNDAIDTDGIKSSPLLLLNSRSKEKINRFIEKFDYDLFNNHYRRVIDMSMKGREYISLVCGDVRTFLKVFEIDDTHIDGVVDVVGELIGNATEHGSNECLVDIDVAPDYIKKGDLFKNPYYAINIVVYNLSEKLLGTGLSNKIKNEKLESKRYKKVVRAYANHEMFFDKEYREEDFFNITAFQKGISERKGDEYTGGRGLTSLLESLCEASDMNNCYVLTGNRVLRFMQEYTKPDDDEWIGFNNMCDFENAIPSKEVLDWCNMFFPGTAYNLNFVLKKK